MLTILTLRFPDVQFEELPEQIAAAQEQTEYQLKIKV